VVSVLLSITFACGLVIAVSHVINQRFVAPVYDVVANLTAFGSAVAASLLLGHWIPAALSAVAILCWLALGRRTFVARRTASDNDVDEMPALSRAST
jgi:hypothetical protein